jgi:hypothetical protein
MIWTLIILGYVALGVYVYGITFAYFQREYPTIAGLDYSSDRRRGICFGLVAPISVFVVYRMSHNAKHGLKFK